jgi:hypothetical protein
VNKAEECDDGNNIDGDGCSAACQNEGCSDTGAACLENGDCCSQSCGTDGLCAAALGCTETGQACGADGECCSNACGADGLCAGGGACTANGNSCSNSSECCSAQCDLDTLTCAPENSGCTATDQACIDSAECCSNICSDGFCAAIPAGNVTCGQGNDVHICQCADGQDNDGDGDVDTILPTNDLQCLGPSDDNEAEFATGIPGDNNGANGATECPFDGNSGPGNDGDCAQFLPNGCDCSGCCGIDGNGNNTSENVFVGGGNCREATPNNNFGAEGGPCNVDNDCGTVDISGTTVQLNCITDGDGATKYCSTCQGCEQRTDCVNDCGCCEVCTGPQNDPTCDPVTGSQCVDVGVVCELNATCTVDEDCNANFGETCGPNGVCTRVACDEDPLACSDDTICSLGCCQPNI